MHIPKKAHNFTKKKKSFQKHFPKQVDLPDCTETFQTAFVMGSSISLRFYVSLFPPNNIS